MTSIEAISFDSVWRVRYPSGTLAPFERDQLFISIYDACKHRPTALHDAQNLTAQIVARLLAAQAEPGIIARADIAGITHAVLKPFDRAAATMYAAYHPAK